MPKKLALIIGVGAINGLGAALCRRAAAADYQVVAAGRTAGKIDKVAAAIEENGGKASAHVADVTDEAAMIELFDAVDALNGELDFVAYNAGNAFRHDSLTMSGQEFEEVWKVCCLGGFLAAREAGKRLAEHGAGSILFTGATASIKARAPFLAFASAKAGLRAVAGAMARELGPRGVHVAHAIIDGGIDGERLNSRNPSLKEKMGENGMLSPEAIAESYWQLHLQHPSAWTFEIDLRPFKETF